jgi:hypothetical protein
MLHHLDQTTPVRGEQQARQCAVGNRLLDRMTTTGGTNSVIGASHGKFARNRQQSLTKDWMLAILMTFKNLSRCRRTTSAKGRQLQRADKGLQSFLTTPKCLLPAGLGT